MCWGWTISPGSDQRTEHLHSIMGGWGWMLTSPNPRVGLAVGVVEDRGSYHRVLGFDQPLQRIGALVVAGQFVHDVLSQAAEGLIDLPQILVLLLLLESLLDLLVVGEPLHNGLISALFGVSSSQFG